MKNKKGSYYYYYFIFFKVSFQGPSQPLPSHQNRSQPYSQKMIFYMVEFDSLQIAIVLNPLLNFKKKWLWNPSTEKRLACFNGGDLCQAWKTQEVWRLTWTQSLREREYLGFLNFFFLRFRVCLDCAYFAEN